MIIVLPCIFAIFPAIHTGENSVANEEWTKFKIRHRREYSGEADSHRHNIYKRNVEFIENHNKLYHKGEADIKMNVNPYSDLSPEEFMQLTTMRGPITEYNNANMTDINAWKIRVPNNVDWRQKGAVTGIKHQKHCSSCYAFMTTGTIEGQIAIKRGKLTSLSEQNLVDCSKSYGNHGCANGYDIFSLKYVVENGIATEESYPYEGKEGPCRFKQAKKIAGPIVGYNRLPRGDEEALEIAVATIGPIAVSIYHMTRLQHYSEGLNSQAECNRTGGKMHGVLVVGYGTEQNGKKYWLLKNSWGPHWGENGYFRIARRKNNYCGIANFPIYPIL